MNKHECDNPFCEHDPTMAACDHKWTWVDPPNMNLAGDVCLKCGAMADEPETFAPCAGVVPAEDAKTTKGFQHEHRP